MFVLDTNILSAMMSARPSPELAAWIAGQPEDALYTTAICQAEILAGLAVMPDGRRRVALETAAQAIFADDFNGRVLPFDAAAPAACAEIFLPPKGRRPDRAARSDDRSRRARQRRRRGHARYRRFRRLRCPTCRPVAGSILKKPPQDERARQETVRGRRAWAQGC
jgi:predicted nucleic acid-binding protein